MELNKIKAIAGVPKLALTPCIIIFPMHIQYKA